MKLNDFHITDVEISRINGLKDTIRLDDPNMISDWGSAASKSSEEMAQLAMIGPEIEYLQKICATPFF